EPTDERGALDGTRAPPFEFSLVTLGAFDSAAVTRVAAEAEEPEPPEPDPDQLELEPEPDPPTPEEEPMEVTAEAPPVILAARADEPTRELGAGELVTLIVRAQHGEQDARRYLEAALAETISTDV